LESSAKMDTVTRISSRAQPYLALANNDGTGGEEKAHVLGEELVLVVPGGEEGVVGGQPPPRGRPEPELRLHRCSPLRRLGPLLLHGLRLHPVDQTGSAVACDRGEEKRGIRIPRRRRAVCRAARARASVRSFEVPISPWAAACDERGSSALGPI
jgi:hypothetical protein